jgi:Tol biopolymer transport system component
MRSLPKSLLLATLVALGLGVTAGAADPRLRSTSDPVTGELALVRAGDLFTVRSDGTALTRLTRTRARESAPAWSPDGMRLLFIRETRGNADVFVAGADGRRPRRITDTRRANEYTPAWSPDGRRIAFTSNRTGDYELYVARADGAGVRRLTVDARRGYGSYLPAWSPDGRWIAFSNNSRTPENAEIYVVRPDGKGLRRLTHTRGNAEILGDDGWPAWSPDGRQIVFSSNRTGDGDVWIMAADGRRERRLTGLRRRDDWAPRFSPDGALIAFHSLDERGRSALYVVGADGTGLRRLGVAGTDPAWRPPRR